MLCLSSSIFQEPYIIWLLFMVHMCKMIISPSFFSILKFWFSELSGGWKGKKLSKMTNIYVCHTLYFRNHIWYHLYLWYTFRYVQALFFFFNILIFRIIRGGRGGSGKRAKNGPKWQKILFVSSYITWLWFLIHV